MNEYKFEPYAIEGKYTSAWVTGDVDAATIAQLYTMVNAPAFDGAKLVIMPDAHYGAGCVVGTTIQLNGRISPYSLGVDLSCGVDAYKAIGRGMGLWTPREMEAAIRMAVPTGRDTQEIEFYSFRELDSVTAQQRANDCRRLGLNPIGYEELAKRVGAKPGRVKKSIGSMGGGELIATG